MKRITILANSRQDAAEALEQWVLVHPEAHIEYILAWDNIDGTVKLEVNYKETKEQENGLDNEFKQ